MQDFLTLSTGTSGPAAAPRVAPITGATPASSRARMTLAALSQAYHALDMTQKGGWQTTANTLNRQQNRAGRHKLTPANAFVTLNSALLAVGQPLQTDAPADLTAPAILPPVTVQGAAPATPQANAAFTLTLHAPIYPHALQILAAPPAPAGKTTFPDNTFKAIGSLPGLSTAPADISAPYQAAYGVPQPGSQIALKLIATSPAGIRLPALVLTGTLTAAPDARPAPSPLQIR